MQRRSVGGSAESSGVEPERFRETLARWATGVCIVALRHEDGEVYATTVGSFASLSAEPPLVHFSLGAGAQVLPFLEVGARFVVNVLSPQQRRLATVFADPFPVGPSPFPDRGEPEIAGSHAVLACGVQEVFEVESSRIVIGRVESASWDPDGAPLLYYLRDYRELADES